MLLWPISKAPVTVYAPKKRYYAAKQLYHFVLPGRAA